MKKSIDEMIIKLMYIKKNSPTWSEKCAIQKCIDLLKDV